MPVITVEGPKIDDLDRKRKMVKKLTEAAVEGYNIEDIIIILKETTPDNVAVRGTLLIDRPKK
jgi:4-oxalocrotonate tautomerase